MNKNPFLSRDVIFPAVTCLSAIVLILLTQSRIFFYIGAAIIVGSIGGVILAPSQPPVTLHLPVDQRIIDCAIFVLISILVWIAFSTHIGAPLSFYILVVITLGLILARMLVSPSLWSLSQMLILALILRANLWYGARLVGRDSTDHLAYAKYIVESGHIIPETVAYYHFYPMSHIFAAIVSQVTAVPGKVGMFLSLGITATVSSLGVYLLARVTILAWRGSSINQRGWLLAALVTVIAPRLITRGGVVVAQTYAVGLLPFFLMLIPKRETDRSFLISVILLIAITLGHNLPPLLLFAIFSIVTIYIFTINRISNQREVNIEIKFISLAVIGVILFYHYIQSSYLDNQVGRIISIFFSRSGVVAEAQKELSYTGGISLSDPLLHHLIFLAVVAAFFISCSLLFQSQILGRDNREFPQLWFFISGFFLTGGALSIILGGSQNTGRVLGSILILSAPIVGYTGSRLSERKLGVALVALLILASPVVSVVAVQEDILNRGVSPVDSRDPSSRIHLTDGEYVGAIFVQEYGVDVNSDSNLAGSVESRGIYSTYDGKIHNIGRIGDVTLPKLERDGRPYLFRDIYIIDPGIPTDITANKYYTSGRISLLQNQTSS